MICSVDRCPAKATHRGWCHTHYEYWRRNGGRKQPYLRDDIGRLLHRVSTTDPEACWLWMGSTLRGYARFRLDGHLIQAHRASYILHVGPIPDGYQVDHMCHDPRLCALKEDCPHRRCLNPSHLAAVPGAENLMRSSAPSAVNKTKTHCKRGHPFEGENLVIQRTGKRNCRTCMSEANRAHRARMRARRIGGAA